MMANLDGVLLFPIQNIKSLTYKNFAINSECFAKENYPIMGTSIKLKPT